MPSSMTSNPPSTMAERLGRRDLPPIILDGGLATELERRGHDVSGPLWSARLLRDRPDEVRAVHTSYFAAGAEVATSASYQATYDGFAAIGLDRAATTDLLRRSVRLADEARGEAAEADAAAGHAPRRRWVAASVGPYGAMLADGSEYTGTYGRTVDQLRSFHRPRLEVLAQALAEIDDSVLACETIPSLREVEALAVELARLGVPAWVSLTPAGDRLRTGEPLSDALALLHSVPEVIAVGVNCCDPADVDLALDLARDLARAGGSTRPLVVYPNTGERWQADERIWTGPATLDADRARAWIDEGARALGGCCRVGPALLSRLAESIR